MPCPVCDRDAVVRPIGTGGLHIYCKRCGGFFKISSTLEALMKEGTINTPAAQQVLAQRREALKMSGIDDDGPKDLGPTLYGGDCSIVLKSGRPKRLPNPTLGAQDHDPG